MSSDGNNEMTLKPTWQSEDGRIQLWLGDCLEILPQLPKGSVDAVITDPPYGINYSCHDNTGEYRFFFDRIKNDDSQEVGNTVIRKLWGLPMAIFASPMKPWVGDWRQYLVWNKGGALGGGGDIKTCWKFTWELIQIANNKALNGSRDGAVLYFPAVPSLYELHPNAKPVDLLCYLSLKLSEEDDTIFDPFMGSCPVGISCIRTNRRFIGIEIEPKYFEIAKERIERELQQKRVF